MDDLMIKLKQADYVELHKIVTGLSERTIWERLLEGKDVLEGIPDEWHDWVRSVAGPLTRAYQKMFNTVVETRTILFHQGVLTDRKAHAEAITDYAPWLRSALWLLYDRKLKELDEFLWKQVKPRGDKTDG
jgi:RNA ligase